MKVKHLWGKWLHVQRNGAEILRGSKKREEEKMAESQWKQYKNGKCSLSLCLLLVWTSPQKQRWWRLWGILEGFLSSTPNLGISGPIDWRPPSHWVGFQITGSKLFEIRLACFQRTHLIADLLLCSYLAKVSRTKRTSVYTREPRWSWGSELTVKPFLFVWVQLGVF